MITILILKLIVAVLLILFVMIPLTGRFLKNEKFKKNGIKTYGTVTNSYPTGAMFFGVPQMQITLKYKVGEKTYEGCATFFTRRILQLGFSVPIAVNPKNFYECSILSSKF